MVTCPCCKGSGKNTMRGRELQRDGTWREDPPVVLDCFYCRGSGRVSEALARDMAWERAAWCSCPDGGGTDWGFSDDGPCSFEGRWECRYRKHHYHCRRCGGVTQIG